jgi:hypothetical protein
MELDVHAVGARSVEHTCVKRTSFGGESSRNTSRRRTPLLPLAMALSLSSALSSAAASIRWFSGVAHVALPPLPDFTAGPPVVLRSFLAAVQDTHRYRALSSYP